MSKPCKTPTVYQMEASECGAASLAMIFAYYGRYMPLEVVRVETGVSRDGVNAANMMRAAKKFGLECHGYRKDVESLRTIAAPCIIHWNFNHFVVFEGINGSCAYINDPAIGRRRVTWEELDESFTGIVLTFKPTPAFQKEKRKSTTAAFVRKRMEGQWNVIGKLLYTGLLLFFPGLILSVLSQVFIDDVLIDGYTDWLPKVLIAMGACVILKAGLSYYRSVLLQKLRSKMTLITGYGFLRHLFRLPMVFFDQRYRGDLVDRMGNNRDVNDFLAGELAVTVLNIMIAVFYFAILLLYDWRLTMIGMFSVIACLITVFVSHRAIADKTLKIQMAEGKLFGAICAGLSITATMKASGAEQDYCARILGYEAKLAGDEQRLTRFQKLIGAIPGAAANVTDVLLLLVGGIFVIHGQLTAGMLVAFNTLFDSFAEPVDSLVNFVYKIQTLKANLCRVDDIEKYPQDELVQGDQRESMAFRKLRGQIELKNVSFGYSRVAPPLVEDLSFRLQPGETVAFVGPSGCGKSTVGKLISRLYAPWGGEVLFDGMPASQIPESIINASVATVSQKITLFSGTIRDNLTMWNSAIPQEDVVRAAEDACIHDFILAQPAGYEALLSENASNLSGGQRQRMEIARALVTNPSVLVMDETTSALDPLTEKRILDNISRRGCACVIVAHRLSAFRDCNQILVMHHGKIVQRGTHQSLMREPGLYQNMLRQ